MLTKVKVALVLCGSLLLGGVGLAAAQGFKGGDADGKPTPAQVEAWKAKRAEMRAKMLEKYDTNKDGKLDANERAIMKEERAEAAFKKLDKDGDGKISLEEFKLGKMQARHGHGHKHGGFRRGQAGGKSL